MRQGHSCTLGDQVTAEQAQLHSVLTLSDTVTHSGNTTGNLGGAANIANCLLDLVRIFRIGLVGGEHIVVGIDNGDITRLHQPQALFILFATGSETVGKIATAQFSALGTVVVIFFDSTQVVGPQAAAALDNSLSDLSHCGI